MSWLTIAAVVAIYVAMLTISCFAFRKRRKPNPSVHHGHKG